MRKSKIFLSSLIFFLFLGGLVFAGDSPQPLRVGDSLNGAKDVFFNILKPAWESLKSIGEKTLEIWQKVWNLIEGVFQNIWRKIQSFFGGEMERRKEIIKEEFPKEKEELKKDLPQTLKFLWEKFKDLTR